MDDLSVLKEETTRPQIFGIVGIACGGTGTILSTLAIFGSPLGFSESTSILLYVIAIIVGIVALICGYQLKGTASDNLGKIGRLLGWLSIFTVGFLILWLIFRFRWGL